LKQVLCLLCYGMLQNKQKTNNKKSGIRVQTQTKSTNIVYPLCMLWYEKQKARKYKKTSSQNNNKTQKQTNQKHPQKPTTNQ
jgi:hypothetical protein